MLDWLFIPTSKLFHHPQLRKIWGRELPHVIREVFGVDRWDSTNKPGQLGWWGKQFWSRICLIRASLLYRSQVPYEYIWGHTQFRGRDFHVTRSVLIPRPETEEWVGRVIKDMTTLKSREGIRILDIGTGSGVIAITLKAELPVSQVTAVEVSTSALKVARKNTRRVLKSGYGGNAIETKSKKPPIRFLHGDVFQIPISELLTGNERFDLVVTNPPYVGRSEEHSLPSAVLKFEPHLALFAEDDGLGFYRKLAKIIPSLLKPGGYFYTEIGWQQGKAVERLFASLQERQVVKDMFGKDRLFIGRADPG